MEELVQLGRIALIKAVDAWDPQLAAGEFLGHAIPCIRGEMLRWFRDRTWALRVPRRLKEVSAMITRELEPLSQQLGRAPRPTELAVHLGVTSEVLHIRVRSADPPAATRIAASGQHRVSKHGEDAIGRRELDAAPAPEHAATLPGSGPQGRRCPAR